jgi:DNA topoisomerase-1
MAIKNLVIVESPAKARTIEGYLGKDFIVKSCFGHIRDLAKGDGAIDVKNGFKPLYEVTPDKREVVSELKKLAAQADTVWLASDEDREGEAISWHLFEALKLTKSNTKRIVFHEITKPAILHAVEHPRAIDDNLVNAQQARRVLDRLVGFELSPVLWKKVKPSLSAGRVQSVAVRLIVEREKEIKAFTYPFAYRVTAEFQTSSGKTFKAELPKRFDTSAEAEKFLNSCVGAVFTVKNLEVKPGKKSPSAPFTTSTLQQEASRKLGYSISQTMLLAQKLYEGGHITYMRTDSVNLSELAVNGMTSEIRSNYGDKYLQNRTYTTKSANAQEAHEAIRPTDFSKKTVRESSDIEARAVRLYELIWKRSVASQMADAQLERTVATIAISTAPETLAAEGEVIKFDGFLKLYLESTDDDTDAEEEGMLPPLAIGETLALKQMTAAQKYAKPAPRYTEASLVKKLEELGIGRPSTYAPTISTIQKRGYVVKEDREGKQREVEFITLAGNAITKRKEMENFGAERAKLFPSDIGVLVTEFLMKHFDQIMDYNFTATVEKEFDEIAQGQKIWNQMIETFYVPFHQVVQETTETADRQSGERLLGVDAASGKNVYARLARYGPVVQIGDADDEEKKFASLRAGQSLDTITLEEAMNLFKLPRVVGVFEDKEMKVAIGRFGPYILHNDTFTSIPKTDDPYTISADRAVELILAKRQADLEKIIKEFPEQPLVRVLKGRWGPYIAVGKQNVKIPKDRTPDSLTLADCLTLAGTDEAALVAEAAAKPEKKSTKTTKTTKTAIKKATTSTASKSSANKSSAKAASTKKATTKTTVKTTATTTKTAAKKSTK